MTEQKKTGDSVVLFVASSTASQFHCTLGYYFKLLNSKQPHSINFLQLEKPTTVKEVPFLGRINTWINDDGVL